MERLDQFTDTPHSAPMTEDEVKFLINGWGRDGFFRAKGWGDTLTILSTRPLPVYILSLETQYERRTMISRKTPDDGSEVDSGGPPLDLWEVESPSLPSFESRRIEGVKVPHGETLMGCEPCKGSGHIDCVACQGSGRIARTDRGCPRCGGQGRMEHSDCGGKGRLRQSKTVTLEYTCKTLKEEMFSVPIPQNLLAEAGREIVSEQIRKGGGFVQSDFAPEMEPVMEDLWKQSVPEDHGATRILFQRFRIERVKGHEVVYHTRANAVPQKFWIIGDNQVFGLNAPHAWDRILGVGIPSGAVAAFLLFMLLTAVPGLFHRATQTSPPLAPASSIAGRDGSSGDLRIHTVTPPKSNAAGTQGVRVSVRETEGDTERQDRDDARLARTFPTSSNSGDATPVTPDTDDTPDTPDTGSEEPSPTGTYDVLAGVFSDPDEAQSVVDKAEEAAYTPTTTSTQDPANRLYIVSIQGFWSRESADQAVEDLKERGITAQVRSTPEPSPETESSPTQNDASDNTGIVTASNSLTDPDTSSPPESGP